MASGTASHGDTPSAAIRSSATTATIPSRRSPCQRRPDPFASRATIRASARPNHANRSEDSPCSKRLLVMAFPRQGTISRDATTQRDPAEPWWYALLLSYTPQCAGSGKRLPLPAAGLAWPLAIAGGRLLGRCVRGGDQLRQLLLTQGAHQGQLADRHVEQEVLNRHRVLLGLGGGHRHLLTATEVGGHRREDRLDQGGTSGVGHPGAERRRAVERHGLGTRRLEGDLAREAD